MSRLPLLLALSGCFSPDYGDPSFSCEGGGACPAGYFCHADGLCYTTPGDQPDGRADGLLIDAPPPAGDLCPAGGVLEEGIETAGTLAGAGSETPASCVGTPSGDVYYELVLESERSVALDLTAIGATGVALRSADCATELACAGDPAAGTLLAVDSLAAGTYQVQVFSYAGAAGDFSLVYTTGEPIVRPANDGCAGAAALADGMMLSGQTTVNARDDAAGGCGNGGDVAYTFTISGPQDRRARVTVSNATFDPAIRLEGACGGGATVLCEPGSSGGALLDAFDLAPGAYTVWVEVAAGTPGTFDIGLELQNAVPPPSNDTCTSPDSLVEGVNRSGSTVGAHSDYDLACIADGPDVVHELTLATDRATLVSITPNTLWPLAAELRTQAGCATTALSCLSGGFADRPRWFNRPNLAAGTYDVVVDGAGGVVGDYTIRFDTRAADTTFGYWKNVATGQPYATLVGDAGAVALGISTTPPSSPAMVFSSADEGSYTILLPFAFSFYGVPHSSLTAAVNGFLTFDASAPSGLESYGNDCPLNNSVPLEVIALFWDDLYVTTGADILTKLEGTAPNRRFIIEYNNFDFLDCNMAGTTCRFTGAQTDQQAILYENGDIELRYGPRSAPTVSLQRLCAQPHLGCSATLGIRGLTGADSDLDICNTASVTDGRVVTLVAPR